MGKIKNRIGIKYGKLKVIEFKGVDSIKKEALWLCQCDCGNTSIVIGSNLERGHTISCGCAVREALNRYNDSIKNPYKGTRIYRIWKCMKNRCTNPNHNESKYYYEKGIGICDEWLNSCELFAKWAFANGYNDTLTIDRIDPNKGYSPDNCRWVDYITQANNRTNNKKICYRNENHTISEWARLLGIKDSTLRSRIRSGWDIERAFTTP